MKIQNKFMEFIILKFTNFKGFYSTLVSSIRGINAYQSKTEIVLYCHRKVWVVLNIVCFVLMYNVQC